MNEHASVHTTPMEQSTHTEAPMLWRTWAFTLKTMPPRSFTVGSGREGTTITATAVATHHTMNTLTSVVNTMSSN